jgi:hypothetical protein
MGTDEKPDETKTYILNETAFTKSKTVEELAEIAAGQIGDAAGTVDGDNRDGAEDEKGSRRDAGSPPGRVEGS